MTNCLFIPNQEKKRVLLIDGHNLAYRMLAIGGLETQSGTPTAIVFGLLRSLVSLLKQFETNWYVVVWDSFRSRKRLELYPQYKANRKRDRTEDEKRMYENFFKQINFIKKFFVFLKLPSIYIDGVEADDILSVLAGELSKFIGVTIITMDKDLLQCVDQNCNVYNPIKKINYNEMNFKKLIGMTPQQYGFSKAITGDKGDNIFGVRGVGFKTVIDIVQAADSLTCEGLISGLMKNRKLLKKKTTQNVILNSKIIEKNLKLVLLPLSIQGLQGYERIEFTKVVNDSFLECIYLTKAIKRKRFVSILNRLELYSFVSKLDENCKHLNIALI